MGKLIKKQIFQFSNYQIVNNFGFTLLEITVCIFIIVLAMLGILSLANQNIQVQMVNRNMVVASQLAQEGLEAVRNKRDVNWLEKADWEQSATPGAGQNSDILQGTTPGNGTPVNYTIDAYTGTISDVGGNIASDAAKLYLNSAGFYTHSLTATSTQFSRLIIVGNETTASTSVTCLVQWKKGTNTYNFSAETVLYNWK